MPNTDPHTFNATLAAVDRAMSEPVSAELAAAYERIGELEAALTHIRDGYERTDINHVDFRVGAYQAALLALADEVQ